MTQIRVDLDQCGVFHWWWLIFWGYLYCFSLRFTNSCVFLLFLFQNSLRFINRAFARGIWTVIATTHQKSTKYISKPVSSYFLASPYARLGWFVLFFSNLPPNFWKIWVPTKILTFILWILIRGVSGTHCLSGLHWQARTMSQHIGPFFLVINVSIRLLVSGLNKTFHSYVNFSQTNSYHVMLYSHSLSEGGQHAQNGEKQN